MTANKHFKRLVRERVQATGESYSAALRHLRRSHPTQEDLMQWQRIEKAEFGFALSLPASWAERPIDPKNSPWEAGRFVDPDDRQHDVVVFRQPLPLGITTSHAVAEGTQAALAAEGRESFETADVEIAGRTGTLLRSVIRDAGRMREVSQYFVVVDDVYLCLGCATSAPGEDNNVLAAIADRFEIVDLQPVEAR